MSVETSSTSALLDQLEQIVPVQARRRARRVMRRVEERSRALTEPKPSRRSAKWFVLGGFVVIAIVLAQRVRSSSSTVNEPNADADATPRPVSDRFETPRAAGLDERRFGEADRLPTAGEERAADRTAADVDLQTIGDHYDEMAELGAKVRGEGTIG
jgi:hypothetical protein